jgi:hypothetical protein
MGKTKIKKRATKRMSLKKKLLIGGAVVGGLALAGAGAHHYNQKQIQSKNNAEMEFQRNLAEARARNQHMVEPSLVHVSLPPKVAVNAPSEAVNASLNTQLLSLASNENTVARRQADSEYLNRSVLDAAEQSVRFRLEQDHGYAARMRRFTSTALDPIPQSSREYIDKLHSSIVPKKNLEFFDAEEFEES